MVTGFGFLLHLFGADHRSRSMLMILKKPVWVFFSSFCSQYTHSGPSDHCKDLCGICCALQRLMEHTRLLCIIMQNPRLKLLPCPAMVEEFLRSPWKCPAKCQSQSVASVVLSVYILQLTWFVAVKFGSALDFAQCKVDVCYSDYFLSARSACTIWKHVISVRWLANPNCARRHLPHNFQSLHEYLVHYQGEDSH